MQQTCPQLIELCCPSFPRSIAQNKSSLQHTLRNSASVTASYNRSACKPLYSPPGEHRLFTVQPMFKLYSRRTEATKGEKLLGKLISETRPTFLGLDDYPDPQLMLTLVVSIFNFPRWLCWVSVDPGLALFPASNLTPPGHTCRRLGWMVQLKSPKEGLLAYLMSHMSGVLLITPFLKGFTQPSSYSLFSLNKLNGLFYCICQSGGRMLLLWNVTLCLADPATANNRSSPRTLGSEGCTRRFH